MAAPAYLAGIQGRHAEDGAHRGGLARAVRPEETEYLSGGTVKVSPSSAVTVPYVRRSPSISSSLEVITGFYRNSAPIHIRQK
jgi:hypothetical protein